MRSKRYEATEVDRRTWLHVPSGTPWSTSSDTHQVVEIQKETSSKMYKNVPRGITYVFILLASIVTVFNSLCRKKDHVSSEKYLTNDYRT